MAMQLPITDFSEEQRELWDRVEGLWALSQALAADQIRAALHSRYVGWDMSSPLPHDREAAVRSVTGEGPALQSYELRPLSVQIYEGRVGVVHYSYRARLAAGTEIRGQWTETYLKQGGAWLMISVSGRPQPLHPGDAKSSA